MNPTGGDRNRRTLVQPAFDTQMMAQVVEPANVRQAWARVKSNRGAPGSDGMTIDDFPAYAQQHWPAIRQSLLAGTYQPLPVRRVSIPKPGGRGHRYLGVPCVIDRVIQQAILQVLSPVFDPTFSGSSFGCRPQRSAHGAIARVKAYLKQGLRTVVDLDLEKFFDTIDHDILMSLVSRQVRDKILLKLLGRFLRADVMVNGYLQSTDLGTPQGSPLSPLLANALLDELDKELERRGHRFCRYMDDVVVFVKSHRAGVRVMASLGRFLQKRLKLRLNPRKSQVLRSQDLEYLGFQFRGIRVCWSATAFEAFKARVRKLTSRSWGVSMAYRLKYLRQYLRGWMGYFGISEYYRPIPKIDKWIRRRIRMCFWKQWRKPRMRIQKLLELGTNKDWAITTGVSRKGYWRLARTLATQSGMTNQWLARQGLLSMRSLWIKAKGYV